MGLTREEALRHIKINLITLYDIDENVIECNDAMEIINQIFNDHEAEIKAKDDEIRRLNSLYADTIKDLGDALIEIERLKAELNSAFIRDLKSIKMSSNGKHATWGMLKEQQ